MATVNAENFKTTEVRGLKDRLVIMLQMIRWQVGAPIYVTSGLRPTDKDSEHVFGLGVDISDNKEGKELSSRWRFLVLKAAFALGIRRIGIYDRHIHLGISESKDQDVAWWGTSD